MVMPFSSTFMSAWSRLEQRYWSRRFGVSQICVKLHLLKIIHHKNHSPLRHEGHGVLFPKGFLCALCASVVNLISIVRYCLHARDDRDRSSTASQAQAQVQEAIPARLQRAQRKREALRRASKTLVLPG